MKPATFVILSGALVGPDLVAEFGRIPPAFLPVGTRRLYEKQVEFARDYADSIYITLPTDFEIPKSDAGLLEKMGVRVIKTDPTLSLSGAIRQALDAIRPEGRLQLLWGDTMVNLDRPSSPDSFASARTQHFAAWADFQVNDGLTSFRASARGGQDREIVAGFFDVADGHAFHESLAAHGEFFAALNAYAKAHGMAPHPVKTWLDFGHLHTYYQSRQQDLAARAFNSLVCTKHTIRKSGSPDRKIFAEAAWFEAVPDHLRPYVPNLVAVHTGDDVAYEIEYLYLPLISEIFAFGALPREVWSGILGSCVEFLELCQNTKPRSFQTPFKYPESFFSEVILSKTFSRLEEFCVGEGVELDTPWVVNGEATLSLRELSNYFIGKTVPTSADDVCLWHGDFHFANIFFDFRSYQIKAVDPRGMLPDGTLALYGDGRYDIAKLAHSVVGFYDFLVSGRFELARPSPYEISFSIDAPEAAWEIADDFLDLKIGNYRGSDPSILALTGLLFLSMLPLHAENKRRQYAFVANAFRLMKLMETRK